MLNLRACAGSLLAITVCVCGVSCSGGGAGLHHVSGKVQYQGQPLAGAQIVFHPESGSEGSADFPTATTEADGTFSIKTGGNSGAPEGKYKVSIVCMEASADKGGGMAMGEQVDKLKGAYANPAATNITVEVKSGDNQLEPFELK